MKKISILKKIVLSLTIFMIILISIFIYSTFIEPSLLVTRKYNMNTSESKSETIKIVQFTDTHLGEYYTLEDLNKVVNKINKEEPHIVIFTGDLIDNASVYKEKSKISQVLSKIEAKIGKYAIYGNRDYGGGAVRYYDKIMTESGFKVLKNNSESITYKEKNITILGGDDGLLGNHDMNLTVNQINEDDTNILLIHEPDLADEYMNEPIDLILAGHSHGGQVYIPFYGPIKRNILSEKYNRGLYELDNIEETKLYVSTGLGNTKVPFRFMTIPEIAVFDIAI